MTSNIKVTLVLLVTFLIAPLVLASGPDIHALWDDRCVSCHGHAGEFARKFLTVSNAELQGRHHVHDLRLFLQNHYLAGHSVEPVYNMLRAQAGNDPRFTNECSRCHNRAADFVRDSFILRDGVLYSRQLDMPIREFLNGHRKLQQQDVDYFMQQLMRIANEVDLNNTNSK
ncbi:MAG: hypothetical protein OEX12_14580 [Gammaproteobacteria bacterium]|nr:hypothetical protein [Gammaproteobacteria bacterium]